MSAVDQRVGTGASRVKRLLSRALLVVGGTLAGTAAAWALSTAPASAQVPIDHGDAVTEVTQSQSRFEEALPAVGLTPVGQAVQDLDLSLRTPQVREPNPPKLGRVAEEIRGAVGHMGSLFQPRKSELSPADRVVGGTVAQRATETTPAAAAVPVSAGTPVVRGVFGKLSRTWLDTAWQPVTALSGTSGPSLPGDPSGLPSMPFAPPLGVPVHCSCGGDGSGSSGGGSGQFTTVSTDRLDSAVARALFPATVRNVVMPGKQPGITPD